MYLYVFGAGYCWRELGCLRFVIPNLAILTPDKWVLFVDGDEDEDADQS
jgi:hypothetical protein